MLPGGRFREGLFYRVAVGVLQLPPLRQREDDLLLLCDVLLTALDKQGPALAGKKVSADAKDIILRHKWPGNVRELQATLLRAALWCRGDTIKPRDMASALFEMPPARPGNALIFPKVLIYKPCWGILCARICGKRRRTLPGTRLRLPAYWG